MKLGEISERMQVLIWKLLLEKYVDNSMYYFDVIRWN